MATEKTYNGDGSDTTFDITFPYLTHADIGVSVGGVTKTVGTDYTISGNTVTFGTAPASGTDNVKLYRNTNIDTAEHEYAAGSSITAASLNENQKQALYAIEEAKLVTTTSGGITTGNKNDITVNSDTDWVIRTNAVEKSMMADNSVGTDEIETNAVTAAELADNAVDTAAIVADAVNGTKIADDSIGAEHITANAVGASELADNAVDTAAIADNAVTMAKLNSGALPTDITVASANLVNGTVATADIADSAITTAKMAATRFFGSYAVLQEVQSHGTNGTDMVVDTWTARELNTEYIDPDGIILGLDNKATSGNLKAASPNGTGGNYSVQPAVENFTLGAGTYLIKWNTIFFKVERCKSRLKDVTNSAIKAVSMNAYSNDSGSYSSVNSHGITRITITGNTNYVLEYFIDAETSSTGGGLNGPTHADNTEQEVYTIIEIYKEL